LKERIKMMIHEKKKYRLTTISCFVGIFTQAIITNLTAILFIPLMKLYGFHFVDLGILVGINFATQVSADILFSGAIDKIGFRKIVLPTCVISFVGLILFGLTPMLLPHHVFAGLVVSTILFSFSSGLLEVVLSPIIDAIPNEDKGMAMSLMHSFYAWGQVATIIITTLFIFVAGNENWQWIVFVWAIVPFTAFILFLKSEMPPNTDEKVRSKVKDMLFHPFFLFALAAILFGGATEVCMNQWASTFMNASLHIPKVMGDLLGMCGFSVMLGLGRTLYGVLGAKISLNKVLIFGSGISVLCYITVALSPFVAVNIIACVLTGLFCSLLWPGVIVLSSERFPLAGAWMFAILAAAGDIGAATGPYLTGIIAEYTGNSSVTIWLMHVFQFSKSGAALRMGILFSCLFPLATFLCQIVIVKLKKKSI